MLLPNARSMRCCAPPPHHQNPAAAQQTGRRPRAAGAAWQRGSRPRPLPNGAATLVRDPQQASPSLVAQPPLPAPSSPAFQAALQQSISRCQTTAEALAAAADADPQPAPAQLPVLREALKRLGVHAELALFQDSLVQLEGEAGPQAPPPGRAPDAADTSPPHSPRLNSERQLAVPGVADVAVASRGGRARGAAKPANQDAWLLQPLGGGLLVGVLDGHGRGGEAAAGAAAEGLAASVPSLHRELAASSSSGAAQEALVRSFQAVGASMALSSSFAGCGTAALACVVQPDSITAAWVGDCRAVAGLSLQTADGPRRVTHVLTQDHKPCRREMLC